jgi:hypothetical protein
MTNLINCIYAEEIGRDCCVKCKLALFGGSPARDICNNLCPQKEPKPEQVILKIENEVIAAPAIKVNRFDTCKHRSVSEMERVVKMTCCSSKTEKGYLCQLLDIFPLQSDRCVNCDKYELKV